MNEEESFDEWLTDFASSPYTTQELSALKTRPEAITSDEVQALIMEIEFLRYLLKSLLERRETAEDGLAVKRSMRTH